ncbi:MAG: hypothetical protein U9O82_12155 [Thermodesulfobacteriota bacterium]|nr:hypothetical protein [Thermodesulfobacteriota bacterium]
MYVEPAHSLSTVAVQIPSKTRFLHGHTVKNFPFNAGFRLGLFKYGDLFLFCKAATGPFEKRRLFLIGKNNHFIQAIIMILLFNPLNRENMFFFSVVL